VERKIYTEGQWLRDEPGACPVRYKRRGCRCFTMTSGACVNCQEAWHRDQIDPWWAARPKRCS
jgi:hypothetical protein